MSTKQYHANNLTMNVEEGHISINNDIHTGWSIVTLENATLTITDGTLYVVGARVRYEIGSENEYVPLDKIDKDKFIVRDDQVEERCITLLDFFRRKKTKVIKRYSHLHYRERVKYSYTLNPFKIINIHRAELKFEL